jgi:hypothetical protein
VRVAPAAARSKVEGPGIISHARIPALPLRLVFQTQPRSVRYATGTLDYSPTDALLDGNSEQ